MSLFIQMHKLQRGLSSGLKPVLSGGIVSTRNGTLKNM